MIELYILLSLVIGFCVVGYTIPRVIYVSKVKKLFAVPNERTASRVITPHLGGVGIFAGFYISLVVSLNSFDIHPIFCLLLASVAMFLTGLKDDLIGMSARKKLFFQVLTVLYLILMGGVRITNLHGILGIQEISESWSTFLTLFVMVGIINAYNLIDGIDGLASGVGVLVSIVFGTLFIIAEQNEFALVAFSMTGSLIAFFFFNVFGKENKIFMGDTGSLTLGVVFAYLLVKYLDAPVNAHSIIGSPGIALSILIVPVVDTIRVMSIRISQGRSPFSPDMNHIHHQLIRLNGNNHLHASMTIILANLALIAFACGFRKILGNNVLLLVVGASGFLLAAIPAKINEQIQKRNLGKQIQEAKVISISRDTDVREAQ